MTLFSGFLVAALLIGLATLFPHLLWKEIIEGQVGKQSFVAHMTEAFLKGDLVHGFPMRYFAAPWHEGPGPWAEEVPFFHVLSASIAKIFNLNSVSSGRILSFSFGLLFLYSIYDLAKSLFPGNKYIPLLTVVILFWMPGFQIYSTSVIPDLAMVACVAFAYSRSFRNQVGFAYGALLVACLFKYFAVFAVLALFIYDLSRFKSFKDRARSFVFSGLAVLPTFLYLAYFLIEKVPNPITEYRDANGYGHLAGPFLFHLQFYLRFVTWVFIKNPNLIYSVLAIIGFALLVKSKQAISEKWRLLTLHFGTQVLFALIFASSFFVHDYYALQFLIALPLFAVFALSKIKSKPALALIVTASMGLSFVMVKDATFRLTNYVDAAAVVRESLSFIPDRSETDLVAFSSDFSQPPIPILSQKAGWTFSATRLTEEKKFFLEKLSNPKMKAFVFYAREPGAGALLDEWMKSDLRMSKMILLKDQSFPSEGKKGAATRLVVLKN